MAGRHTLALQTLEDRLALAYTVNLVPLTTAPAPTFAYVIAIDDNVDASGNGRNLFMQAATDGNPYFLIDNNPGFSNPTRLSRLLAGLGACSTVLVISSNAPTNLPGGDPAGDLPTSRGVTTGTFAQGFTFQASTTVPTERLIVDLSPVGSRISIESPWNAALGDNAGNTPGSDIDWPAYISYGGYLTTGQVALFATQVGVSSATTSTSRFSADVSQGRLSGFVAPIQTVTINAAMQAVDNRIRVQGDQTATPTVPGLLSLSSAGSMTATGTMSVTTLGGNIQIDGSVTAPNQTYQLNAMPMPGGLADPLAYTFSTRSQATGVQAGKLVSSGSIGITMGNPAGGTVDLRTNASRIAFQSGSSSGVPYRYDVAIEETDGLQIDSVGSSSGPMAFKTGGNLTILGDAIRTTGDLLFAAGGSLTLSGSVNSANGNIQLESNTLSLGSDVVAGGGKSVTLRSTTGSTTTNALVRAGGPVKQPVAAASEKNYALAGLGAAPIIDTVTLSNNDRILLKNQTDPKENGIYVFTTAGGGVLTRATDADSSAKMPSGFVVFSLGGTQMGAWTFRNPNSPQFVGSANQTALSFVPATATQVYTEARFATTAADGTRSLFGTAGTVDGQTLSVGDRILVKNQSNAAENGIYVVSTGAWQRASDADSTSELRAGSYVFVTGGTTLSGTGWALQNDAIQVGITNLAFTSFTQQPPSALAPWAPAKILQNARVATTTNISLAGLQTIDGVALIAGDVVLVKNQTNATQNGLYTVAVGAWTPVAGMPPPRGASVYVMSGVKNGITSWQFNDGSSRLATLALNSPSVTGLASTAGLSVGMLVTGVGIPSGTTITSKGTDGTSIQLSANALLSSANAPLTFTATTAVTGTTPIVFVPAAGAVTVTSATSIGGTSSLQGATALLTAGAASSITAQTKVGRIAASAPASISITSATAVELEQVQTTTAGSVTVAADGTLTALSVATKGTAGTPGSVSLTATSGDVVAESITTNLGDILLTSVNDSIYITKARFQAANVSTTVGNISLTANRPTPTPLPVISVDGRVNAQGTGGVGDITLTSTYGQAQFTGNAVVAAADTLKIDTRNSVVSIAGTPQIAASALDLTSQFGAGKSSYDSALGSYQVITLNRTDTGDIDIASPGSLVVRGATTITDPLFPAGGSIKFQAPDITVAGPIQPGGTATDITLIATAGNLNVDQPLTSPRNITLATTGRIATSSNAMTPLLTAAGTLAIVANTRASVMTKVDALDAQLSGAAAVLDVVESDSLKISKISTPAGGSATITAGTSSAGGSVTVSSVNMGPSGSVKITAYQDILDNGSPAVADIVANRAELIATTGKIDVDTDVNILLAQATQKNQTITVDDLGTGPTAMELLSVATTNANIAVTAKRSILATSVTTAGSISLTTANAGSDILVNTLSALGNTITLSAGGSILEASPADPTADISATTVSLTATAGSIDVHLDASAVAATANAVGTFIKIKDDNSLSIGSLTDGISGKSVTITVGSGLTQTKAIVADSLSVTAATGAVSLDTVANDVDVLTVSGKGGVSFQDVDGLDVGTSGISGGVITLAVGGALTQTGPITGTSLAITSSAGSVTLTNSNNDVGSLAVTLTGATAGRTISYTDANTLAIGVGGVGITGGDVSITTLAGTGITVNAPVVAGAAGAGDGNILLKATAGNIALAANLTAKDDTITLDASNGTITQTAGAIDCNALVWYAKSQPTFLTSPPNSFAVVGPNLTAPGSITINNTATATLTVAGASTVDGDISITGKNIIITDLVKAGGTSRAVAITATTGGIAFQSAGRIINNTGSSATVSLAAASGAIDAQNTFSQTTVSAGGNLAITAKNNSALSTAVASVSGTVSAGNLDLTEADALSLIALSAQAISLAVGGALTQTGPITGMSLAITSSAGSVTLTNSSNDVGSLAVTNGTRAISFTDKNGLDIAGLTGGALVLNAGGSLTQTGAITGTSLGLTSSAGTVTLTNANNDVATISLNNGIGDFSYAAKNAVAITAAGPLTIGLGGLAGAALSLTVGGNLTQTGAITGTSLGITATAGTVTLTNANNDVDSLSVNNGNRAASFTDKDDLAITGLTGGALTLAVGGNLTQTGAISGTTLAITALNQTVTLLNSLNDVTTVNVSNAGGVFFFNDRNSVTMNSTGTLSVGTITAGTTATITTSGGGNLDIGPQPNGLLQAGNTLILTGVQGNIILRNGGRIQAPSVQLPAGKGIQIGDPVTDAAGLNQTIATINSLPAISGSAYEIVVDASFALTQTLVVNRPIALRGTSQSVVLSGSATVRSGLVLNSANGSSVRSLAFSGFADDAIRLNSTLNATISGVAVRNSGNGLTINGAATGTKVQGNVFDRNSTGVRLLSATGALIGGSAAGQANTISNARIGVFASGFCTGTQVVKNRVTTTTTPYDVRGSRNLTLVQ